MNCVPEVTESARPSDGLTASISLARERRRACLGLKTGLSENMNKKEREEREEL